MKKRVLALFLTAALAAGLLTGCGSKGTEGEQASSQEASASSSQETQVEADVELTTIKILCKNDYSSDVKTKDWEKYPASQKVISDLAQLGVRLELEYIDNESFGNTVQTRMASGTDLPDLIAYCWVGAGENDILNWAKNGLVYPVNELIEQYDTDHSINAFYDEEAPGVWSRSIAEDGNVYWFTYLAGPPRRIDKETGEEYIAAYPHTLSIRADWLAAIGEEVKEVYTPQELLDLVKKMQDADINGNGQKDEVIYSSIDRSNLISDGFGLNTGLLAGYFEGDNQVFSNFYDENFPEYIRFMQSLYQNGLIDTTMLTTSQDEMISQNRVAVVTGYAVQDGISYEDVLPNAETEKSYYMPFLLDLDGDLNNGYTVRMDSISGTSYCQYFIPKGAENVEAVMKVMDYVYTKDYALLNQLGLEGSRYEVDSNGNYVELTSRSEDAVTFRETSAGLYAIPSLLTTPIVMERNYNGDAQYRIDKTEWAYHFRRDLRPLATQVSFTSQALAMPTEEENQFLSEKVTVLETYASELLADLILGNKSLDDLPTYLEELEKLGLQEYIDIMQARRDRAIK